MPLDELNEAIDSSRRGATLAARNLSDHAELINVAELIGNALEGGDDALLGELEKRTRIEAPEALPWLLSILRTLTGTFVEQNSIGHLVLIPVLHDPLCKNISLEAAIHEVEGSLEYALDLGHGSLSLQRTLLPFTFLQHAKYSALRALLEGSRDCKESLKDLPLAEGCSAIVGRWTVERSDRLRLSRKLLHALQRTPELIAWQRRTEALLAQQCDSSFFSVYPVLQLQDYFSGVRQIVFVHSLERAYRQLPEAHLLSWEWRDRSIVCELKDVNNRKVAVEGRFPDEPKEFAQMRLAAFCTRRSLFMEPPLPAD